MSKFRMLPTHPSANSMDKDDRPMEIHREIVESIDSGCRFALALILKAEGSTPREAGVKAIIDDTGKIRGTIGGGDVEAEAQHRAIEACESGRPVVFDINLHESVDAGPICGGSMRILIDPTAAKDREFYARAAEALERRQRGVLLTTVRIGAETDVTVEWYPEERDKNGVQSTRSRTDSLGTVPIFPDAETIRSCLARERARLFVADSSGPDVSTEALVQPIIPRPVLLIVGGGHVGQALARQAVLIGFDVAVVDDRPEFANPARFPKGVTTRCADIARTVADFPICKDTYVVIVTRAHKHDEEALKACIHAPAAYIGMIGSKRKVELIRKNIIESGVATEEELDRVFAPIGLDIGAVTVPEIATSIVAQLTAVRRRGDGPAAAGMMSG